MLTEVYKPVQSLDIPGRSLDEIQGETVVSNLTPFKTGHIPTLSIVALGETDSLKNGTSTTNSKLVQITDNHGRSFELKFGRIPYIFWADQYGNYYSSLTTKGNQLTSPEVVRSRQEPSGFAVFGMQDTTALVRILRASRLLREHQGDTECFIKVIEPEVLPFAGEIVPLEQFKANLIQQIWDRNGKKEVEIGNPVAKTDIPQYSEHLDNSTFVITIRGMQVAERIQDLEEAKSKEEFVEIMKRIFKFVNLAEVAKAKANNAPNTQPFNAESDEDLERYFQDYLPRRVALNYSKLHNLGLVHIFAHQGNISAVGSIYDLDSIKGEILNCGDERVSPEDQNLEFSKVLNETCSSVHRLSKYFLPASKTKGELQRNFEKNFQQEYFSQRNILDILSLAWNCFDGFAPYMGEGLFTEYMRKMVKELGFDFHTALDINEQVEEFTTSWDRDLLAYRMEECLKSTKTTSIDEILVEFSSKAGLTQNRFLQFLEDQLDEEFILWQESDHADKLYKLCEGKPAEFRSIVFKMFQAREVKILLKQLTTDLEAKIESSGNQNLEELEKNLRKDYKEIFMKFVIDDDKDFDPVGKLQIYLDLFDHFDEALDNVEARSFMELYLQRVTQRTGLDHLHPETVDQLISLYLIEVEIKANMFFPEIMARDSECSFQDRVDTVLGQAFNSIDGIGGFPLFISDRVFETMTDYYKKERLEIDKKWGRGHAEVLCTIFALRERLRIENTMTDDQVKKLEKQVEELETKLRSQFQTRQP